MKITGTIAQLNRQERRLFACGPEEFVERLPCVRVIDELIERRRLLEKRIAADALAAASQAAEHLSINADMRIAADVAGPVLVYEIERAFDIPHDPAPDTPDGGDL